MVPYVEAFSEVIQICWEKPASTSDCEVAENLCNEDIGAE